MTMLFAPIKNKLQLWADRWFYGERYTLRTGFRISAERFRRRPLCRNCFDSLVRRLSEMLSVRKVAIFIEDGMSPSGFRLAHASGMDGDISLPEDIKKIIRMRSIGRGFISASDIPRNDAVLTGASRMNGRRRGQPSRVGYRERNSFRYGIQPLIYRFRRHGRAGRALLLRAVRRA